jgi:uncharacterized membrane protein YhaH (DUF805 family)
MMHALFGFTGRMNRAPFWGWSLSMLVLIVAAFAAAAFAVDGNLPDAEHEALIAERFKWVTVGATVLTLWPLTALSAKRLQDLGHPAWWAIPVMVPSVLSTVIYATFGEAGPGGGVLWVLDHALTVVAIVLTIWLGFFRGTRGDNPHGPDPLAGTEAGRAKEAGVGV